MYVRDWVKVKKHSPSWFLDPYLAEAEKTMVMGVNTNYRLIMVAHLMNKWLPMEDFEVLYENVNQ